MKKLFLLSQFEPSKDEKSEGQWVLIATEDESFHHLLMNILEKLVEKNPDTLFKVEEVYTKTFSLDEF